MKQLDRENTAITLMSILVIIASHSSFCILSARFGMSDSLLFTDLFSSRKQVFFIIKVVERQISQSSRPGQPPHVCCHRFYQQQNFKAGLKKLKMTVHRNLLMILFQGYFDWYSYRSAAEASIFFSSLPLRRAFSLLFHFPLSLRS
jgi:hypothetical protein